MVQSVCLLAHTPDPDLCVVRAARLCYSEGTAEERFKEVLDTLQIQKFLEKLRKSGHLSPFEHASFTFGVDHISRVSSHQFVRHRLASFSQQSQRYVPMKTAIVILPPSVEENEEAKAVFEKIQHETFEAYEKLCLLGVPREDARYVLPHGFETSLMVTMNARELLHFLSIRLCRRAQWEIQNVAREMLLRVREVAPALFASAGPSCVTEGICKEEMSCGQPFQNMEALLQM